MDVKAKALDTVNTSLSIDISSLDIKQELEKLASKAAKTMKMDGFRVGKVPVSAVIKRYEKELRQDAEQALIKESIDKALKDSGKEVKDLVGEPYFEKVERKDEGLQGELILSFKPSLNLNGYEELIPSYQSPKVTKKEIDEKKENLLKSYAKTEAISEDRELKEKDFAKFDFEGFVDEKAFDGGKAENYVLEIGSKQFIPGFEDGMLGMKKGEQRDVKVKFPDDYGAANLAGKEAVFKVKLHEIQELKLPNLDEDLLKKLLPNEENASEELLDEKLKEQIKNEKIYKLINEELKTKLADALLEKYVFDIPKGIVEQEMDVQFRNAVSTFTKEELEEFKNDENKYKEKRESFRDEAVKSVKLTFIINELAALRKIAVSEQELIQTVYFEAYRYGTDPQKLLESYKQQGVLPIIKMSLLEEKLFNDIFMPKDKKKAEAK
ncbi:trigger factor (peptidyl-prolyl cis /trans isomerase, chaperone) [Campylobacter avium LMG 24591]|uniref:Trigger factor n=1 Tax=Campylobacter avium LMG 24591 TaxID=522484 RepID=A0A222MUS8_9BACT|nr:trigger factor [Campylobacter avium]ASQ29703.1 trigger factor (peptidyl-prolyl cis /trans isomerase, chaperone) [Campylobacter avium LMG 24591]OYD80019.1 trigger factor (peptidyl-prolyl cis /trans isomerase, chaperone) [Campylobacter avium]